MALKPFRCIACVPRHDFADESAAPACPQCKLTYPAVVPLVYVHLLAPGGPIYGEAGSMWHMACLPGRSQLFGTPSSDDPRAVTCPACKGSAEFAKARQAFDAAAGILGGPHGDPGGCC